MLTARLMFSRPAKATGKPAAYLGQPAAWLHGRLRFGILRGIVPAPLVPSIGDRVEKSAAENA